MRILDVLNRTTDSLRDHRIRNPRLNAELLISHSLKVSREGLYIRLQDPIGEEGARVLEGLLRRRLSGEPLQYVLGRQPFWTLDIEVDPRVLIPRGDTEVLVEQSLALLTTRCLRKPPVVLEIGTGSGAVAITLAREIPEILLVATDISEDALFMARKNAARAGVLPKIFFVRGDLLNPIQTVEGREPFDLILSNPPYIVQRDLENLDPEVRDFEPRIALDGGADGLLFHRRIVSGASRFLKREGGLLLEVGQGQAGEVSRWIVETGAFHPPERIQDLSGIERVVKAIKRS